MRRLLIASLDGALALGIAPMASAAPASDSTKARTEILQDVVYAYAYGWDKPDCNAVAAVFATDGVLDFRGHPTLAAPDSLSVGRDQVRTYCQTRVDALAPGSEWFHYMTNPVITPVSATRAKGQVMGLVLIRTSPTATPTIAAVITYQDTYVKRNGKWLLLKRVAT